MSALRLATAQHHAPERKAQPPLAAVDRLLTAAEVGARLAVSRSMIYKLLRTGELPAVYVGRLPRIADGDLVAYIERQRATQEAAQ